MKLLKTIAFLTLLSFFITSCSEYQKVLKSSDYELKYLKACEYYDKKDYYRCLSLLDELLTVYRGTDKAEDVNYKYAYSYYFEEDYILAGYHFDLFTKTFPNSDKVEECMYMSAFCYYEESPNWNLDQTNTLKAIEAMQLFINKFPLSPRVEEANGYIDKLRGRLETKAYSNSKLYLNLSDYQAAVITIKNTLNEYPDTKYREELTFMILKANYLYAQNSVVAKKKERFQDVVNEYYVLLDEFPQSDFLKEAEDYYTDAIEEIKK